MCMLPAGARNAARYLAFFVGRDGTGRPARASQEQRACGACADVIFTTITRATYHRNTSRSQDFREASTPPRVVYMRQLAPDYLAGVGSTSWLGRGGAGEAYLTTSSVMDRLHSSSSCVSAALLFPITCNQQRSGVARGSAAPSRLIFNTTHENSRVGDAGVRSLVFVTRG